MRLAFTSNPFVIALGLSLLAACGSSTFETVGDKGGAAGAGPSSGGKGATGGGGGKGGSSGKSGSAGTSGSSSGTSGSSSGSAGSSSGSAGDGGTAGSDGGSGGGGGTTGGAGGAGGLTGGAAGGAGMGGTTGGVGGSAAGMGGTVAGSAGCGICPFVACAPAVNLTVAAPENIGDLTGTITNATSGTVLGELQCYPNGGTPCTWYCQYYQISLGGGDYTIELSASGYAKKTIEFSVETPTNCGCCGCGCGPGYTGNAELEPDGGEIPACCVSLNTDPTNCGSCGNVCDTGYTCTSGECTEICSNVGANCAAGTYPCCGGLTCCPPDSLGQSQCATTCP